MKYILLITIFFIFSCSSGPPIKTAEEHIIRPYYISQSKAHKKQLLKEKEKSDKLQILKREVSKINWFNPTEETVQKAYKENKLIVIYLKSNKSNDCLRLEEITFIDPKIENILNNKFIAISVDIDTNEQFLNKANLDELIIVPSFSFFSSDGEPIATLNGFQYPDSLLNLLEKISRIWDKNAKK